MRSLLGAALVAAIGFQLAACAKDEKKSTPEKAFSEMTVDGFEAEKTLEKDESYKLMTDWAPASCKGQPEALPSEKIAAELKVGQKMTVETRSNGHGFSSLSRETSTVKKIEDAKVTLENTVLQSQVSHHLYTGPVYTDTPFEEVCELKADTDSKYKHWSCQEGTRPMHPELIEFMRSHPDAFKDSGSYCDSKSEANDSFEEVTQLGTYVWNGERRQAVMTKHRAVFTETCRKSKEENSPIISQGKVTQVSVQLFVRGVLDGRSPGNTCRPAAIYWSSTSDDSTYSSRLLEAPSY